MTMSGIEHFREPEEWSEDYLQRIGYRRFSVSIFDHWLNREEWDSNPFVSLERARAKGMETTYHQQNYEFRAFYRCLFEGGVYRITGLQSKPQVVWHGSWDRRLKKAVMAMIEDKRYGAKFHAPETGVQIISSDARTDTILFDESADETAIRMLASHHGLHLIA